MNGTNNYSFEVFPFAAVPIVRDTAVDPEFRNNLGQLSANHDDTWAGPYPIGFSFCFLNNTFREYWIGSNGWITFTDPMGKGWTIFTPFAIPSTNSAVPKNAIFAPYQDWNPSSGGPSRSKVYRHIVSDPPSNSKLVVYWDSCALYGCSTAVGVFQIVVNQSDFSIENNITVKPSCTWQSNKATQGVHNSDGTIAFTALGRNMNAWTTTNESTRFVPNGIVWYKDAFPGGAIAGFGPSITVSPVVATNYFAVIATCTGSNQSARVNVRIKPTPTLSGPATACFNSTQKYTTEAGMINYTWSVTGGVISGGGTATADTVLVTWNNPAGVHEVSIVYTEPVSGCANVIPVVKQVSLIALPVPTITSGVSPVCPGDPDNLYTTQPGMSAYSWTVSAGGLITSGGGPADNWMKVTWNTTGTSQASAGYTDPATGCTSASPAVFSVTVKPIPDVTFTPLNPSGKWCSQSPVQVNLGSSFAGATFTWTATANPLTMTPPAASGNGNISQAFQNIGFAMENVNILASATFNGCTSAPYPYTAQVYPVPNAIVSTPFQYICSGGMSSPVALTSNTAGASFSWAYPCGSGTLTPCPGSGTGNSIPAVSLNNSANSLQSVIFTVTAGIDNCPGTTASHILYVNPKPAIANSSMSQNVCLGSSSSLVNLTSTVNPAQYQWNASPSHPSITGYTAGPQTTSFIPVQTLNDPLNVNGSVTYTVVPNITMNSLTCYGDPADYVINTKAAPDATISGPSPALACDGQSNTFSVPPDPGTVFTWSLNPSTIGTLTSTQGLPDATFLWNGSGSGILASVSALSAFGCTSSANKSFLIYPKPIVNMDLCIDPVTTPDAKPYVLRGGRPFGATGTYSGTGVSLSGGQYVFDPATVTAPFPKAVQINYSYTNMYGCPASDTKTVQVVALPAFQCGNNAAPLQDVRTTPRRDYPTYFRGGKCWMTVNLDYGTSTSYVQPQADNCLPEKYCALDDPFCSSYGGFYQWNELMQFQSAEGSQGLCPPGWHVPTRAEWQALIDDPANQGNGLAGGFLKDIQFSAKTAGVLYMNSIWTLIPSGNIPATMFWTSTSNGSGKAFARGMNAPNTSTSYYSSSHANAFSVRCVKD